MIKKVLIAVMILFAFTCSANAADVVTSGTVTQIYGQGGGAFYNKYIISADANGDSVWRTSNIVGKIVSWLVIPHPTTNTVTTGFDIMLLDTDSFDVFRGNGADLTTATLTGFFEADETKLPINTIGDLTFIGENFGSTGTLTLKIFYKYQ